MPRFDADPKLKAPGTHYVPRNPEWVRQRQLVFITGIADMTASLAVQQIQYVTALPRTKRDSHIFVPSTHYVVQSDWTEADDLRKRLEKRLTQHEAELGISLVPTIHRREGASMGVLAGTGLHLARADHRQKGLVGLKFKGDDRLYEARLTGLQDASDIAAGIYRDQTTLIAGFDPHFPIRFALETEALLNKVNLDQVIILSKPSPASRPILSFSRVCRTSLPVLTGLTPERPGVLHSLLVADAAAPRQKSIEFDPGTGWAEVQIGPQTARPSLPEGERDIVLHVRPDLSFSRLRHADTKLDTGGFAVVGILLPTPGEFGAVEESYCNLDRSRHLVAHALDDLQTTLCLSQSRRLLLLSRSIIATCFDENGPQGRPIRIDGRPKRIGSLGLGLRQGLKTPNSGDRIENLQSDQTLFARSFVLIGVHPTGSMGYFRCPLPFMAAPGEAVVARAPIIFERQSVRSEGTVCLDWLDDSAGAILHDGDGSLVRVGLAELFHRRLEALDVEQLVEQALVLAPGPDGQRMLHLEDRAQGEEPVYYPVADGGLYRLGPLLCRYVMPQVADVPVPAE